VSDTRIRGNVSLRIIIFRVWVYRSIWTRHESIWTCLDFACRALSLAFSFLGQCVCVCMLPVFHRPIESGVRSSPAFPTPSASASCTWDIQAAQPCPSGGPRSGRAAGRYMDRDWLCSCSSWETESASRTLEGCEGRAGSRAPRPWMYVAWTKWRSIQCCHFPNASKTRKATLRSVSGGPFSMPVVPRRSAQLAPASVSSAALGDADTSPDTPLPLPFAAWPSLGALKTGYAPRA